MILSIGCGCIHTIPSPPVAGGHIWVYDTKKGMHIDVPKDTGEYFAEHTEAATFGATNDTRGQDIGQQVYLTITKHLAAVGSLVWS